MHGVLGFGGKVSVNVAGDSELSAHSVFPHISPRDPMRIERNDTGQVPLLALLVIFVRCLIA